MISAEELFCAVAQSEKQLLHDLSLFCQQAGEQLSQSGSVFGTEDEKRAALGVACRVLAELESFTQAGRRLILLYARAEEAFLFLRAHSVLKKGLGGQADGVFFDSEKPEKGYLENGTPKNASFEDDTPGAVSFEYDMPGAVSFEYDTPGAVSFGDEESNDERNLTERVTEIRRRSARMYRICNERLSFYARSIDEAADLAGKGERCRIPVLIRLFGEIRRLIAGVQLDSSAD